jgi:hypothetical protein
MKMRIAAVSAMFASLLVGAGAQGNQYPTLDPAYTQEIYTGPLAGAAPGMAWTSANNLLTRNGGTILEYSLTQSTVHQGTPLHGIIGTFNIPNLSPTGYGMTNGLDGYVYTVTGFGLQRFDPNNLPTTTAQFMPNSVGGQGYGVTTLPDGRIAYSDGNSLSKVYIYNPATFTNTQIFSAPFLVDGMVAGPGGHIALAGQSNSSIMILANTGAVVNSFNTAHYPDGLAFSETTTSSTLYSNNNDGTITKYVLGPGYTGVPVATDIATGSGAYGDLASVGPDCAFYVSQVENGGYHGSTPGIGTHWNNSVTNTEPSIVRIGSPRLADGTIDCHFYAAFVDAPEPGSVSVLLTFGALCLSARRRGARRD